MSLNAFIKINEKTNNFEPNIIILGYPILYKIINKTFVDKKKYKYTVAL